MLLSIKIVKIFKLYAFKYKFYDFMFFYMQINIKTGYCS